MLLSGPLTTELLAPCIGFPHVTILSPPEHQTAKAPPVEATLACCTTAVGCSASRIPAACNESMGFLRARFPAVTILKNFYPKDSCAKICKSSTVESSGSRSVSLRPLGSDTLTLSILSNTRIEMGMGQYLRNC